MDLLTAFRDFAPPAANPKSAAYMQKCAQVLLEALIEQARKLPYLDKHQITDDAIAEVLAKLYRSGPRGVRAGDDGPNNPVGGYLFRCLRNYLIDCFRKHKAELLWDDPSRVDEVGHGLDPVVQLEAEEAGHQLDAVERQLFDEIVPAVAASGVNGVAFTRSIALLRSAVQQQQTVEQVARAIILAEHEPIGRDVVEAVLQRGLQLDRRSAQALAQLGLVWHPSADQVLAPCHDGGACCGDLQALQAALVEVRVPRLRVNLDARFQRARARLLGGIERLRAAQQLTAAQAELLCLAARTYLRFYQAGGPT